jgi:hypothetical protein
VLIILLEQIIRAETVQWLLHFLVLFALTNDRIALLFAAMQMVASATKQTLQPSRLMSAFGGIADMAKAAAMSAFDPEQTSVNRCSRAVFSAGIVSRSHRPTAPELLTA